MLGLSPEGPAGARPRALVSYLAAPVAWPANSAKFDGHSNAWESAELVRLLRMSGYELDAIDWFDDAFSGDAQYDLILDIHANLGRLARHGSRLVLHATGSHPSFSNAAECRRLSELAGRRGVLLRQRRGVSPHAVEAFDESLRVADLVTLIGNETTLSTFDPTLRSKFRLVTVSGSRLPWTRSASELPKPADFLWFAGSGAVHKGMDLVLEVFAKNPHLTLHCVGPYARELDFVRAYRRELLDLPNIISYGFLPTSSEKFLRIASRCCGFMMPSSSEGISPAAVTCLQFGLVPIISTRCGIDVPRGAGWVLESCTIESLSAALDEVCNTQPDVLRDMVYHSQRFALTAYSREAFSARMSDALSAVVKPHRRHPSGLGSRTTRALTGQPSLQ